MKLLKGIGKLTYRVFHPVKTFVTSKVGNLLEIIKEKYNDKKALKGKLFTDEQFNAIVLNQKNKENEIDSDEEIVSFDEIREEKVNINELIHEYLKNSRIDAFGAEKIFNGVDKIEEIGKTDELIKYINESNDIIPDNRYQKLLDKMYDIVNNVKDEEYNDIFDYLSVYLPDDLSDNQRLDVYQTATKAIENDKSNEDKIREYLNTKKYYAPVSSIDKYNELMSMLKGLTNKEDYDDNIEIIDAKKIDNNPEIIDFDVIKKSDNKEKNAKTISDVDEAFKLLSRGKISKDEFKEVMANAKKDDEMLRKSITKEEINIPKVIKIDEKTDFDPKLEETYRKQLDKISKSENDYKELKEKIKYYEEFLEEHDLSHEEDQEMKRRMEDKLSELKQQYNESKINSNDDRSFKMAYYTQVSKEIDKELKNIEIDKQIKVLTALKEDIVLNVNSKEIKNYNARKAELLQIKKECLERKAQIQSYYDEKTKALTNAWVYFK